MRSQQTGGGAESLPRESGAGVRVLEPAPAPQTRGETAGLEEPPQERAWASPPSAHQKGTFVKAASSQSALCFHPNSRWQPRRVAPHRRNLLFHLGEEGMVHLHGWAGSLPLMS